MTARDQACSRQEDSSAGAAARSQRPGLLARPVIVHVAVLIGYLAAGIAVNWARAAYLTSHVVPGDARDTGLFVWDFWWMARSVVHLSNPWFTHYLGAPAGVPLGFHTLMPLPGVLMTPVTIGFGPSFSYNLLSAAAPGLICYAMYRAARLWLPSQTGAIAAGAFFGLSTMMTWNAWFEIQLALGAIFLPLALEAAVRLGRRPGWRQAAILGVVLGAALLTDQESAIMAGILAVAALLPWLARRPAHGGDPAWVKLRSAALAVAVTGVVASPQLIAMVQQGLAGDASVSQGALAADYRDSGASLRQIFSPSPRVAFFGLKHLATIYNNASPSLTFTAYGWVLIALALVGLAVCWRRRSARLLALFWLGATITALGTGIVVNSQRYVPLAQVWHGIQVSMVMPYTWIVRIPLLSSFREADRFTELGLVAAALLAGAAVNWLRYHATPVLVACSRSPSWKPGASGPGPSPRSPCPLPCPPLTARSRPTIPGQSWWISPSACAAPCHCPTREQASTPRPRYRPPPMATRVPSPTYPGSRSPCWSPSDGTRSTLTCSMPSKNQAPSTPTCSRAATEIRRGFSWPGWTRAASTSAGRSSGPPLRWSLTTSRRSASGSTTGPTAPSSTGCRPSGPSGGSSTPCQPNPDQDPHRLHAVSPGDFLARCPAARPVGDRHLERADPARQQLGRDLGLHAEAV